MAANGLSTSPTTPANQFLVSFELVWWWLFGYLVVICSLVAPKTKHERATKEQITNRPPPSSLISHPNKPNEIKEETAGPWFSFPLFPWLDSLVIVVPAKGREGEERNGCKLEETHESWIAFFFFVFGSGRRKQEIQVTCVFLVPGPPTFPSRP